MSRRHLSPIFLVAVGTMAIGMAMATLNVALPSLVEDLGATTSELQWVVSAFMITQVAFLVACGSLGDRYGRLTLFRIGLSLFIAASLVAAWAPDTTVLIGARGVMGIGASCFSPAGLSILLAAYTEPAARLRAVGLWATTASASIVIGPVAGSFVLAHFWWGSAMLVPVPLALLALALSHGRLKNSRDPNPGRIDPVGMTLVGVGLAALVGAFIEGPVLGFDSPTVLAAFAVALLALPGFVIWESRREQPMFDLKLFRDRRFAFGTLIVGVAFCGSSGVIFVLPQLFRFIWGYGVLHTGLAFLPMAAGFMSAGVSAANLAARVGAKYAIVVGVTTAAIGLLVLMTIGVSSWFGFAALGMFLAAFGHGLSQTPSTVMIMSAVPPEKSGVGSGVNNTTRWLGSSIGVAVIGSLLVSGYRSDLVARADGLALADGRLDAAKASVGRALEVGSDVGGHTGAALAAAAREAFVHGCHIALFVGAALYLVCAVLALVKLPGAPAVRSVAVERVPVSEVEPTLAT